MTSSVLFRLLASAALVPAFAFAQSALVPAPVPAPATGAQAPAGRAGEALLSARLAEVIAMLEEDDLTEEQRAEARQKLQAIAAQLKQSREVVRWRRTPPGTAVVPGAAGRDSGGAIAVLPDGELLEVAEVRSEANALVAPASPDDASKPSVVRLRRTPRSQGGGSLFGSSSGGAPSIAVAPPAAEPEEVAVVVDEVGRIAVEAPAPVERPRVWLGRVPATEGSETRSEDAPFGELPAAARARYEADLRAHVEYSQQRTEQAEESARALREEAVRLRATADRLRRQTQEELAHQRRDRVAEVARARSGQASPFAVRERQTESVSQEEADLRAMVEDMRAEMNAIRELIQQMRVQSKRDDDRAKAGR